MAHKAALSPSKAVPLLTSESIECGFSEVFAHAGNYNSTVGG
jgi:hypothetical protein